MGKRELLIIVGFFIVGAVVFRFTAAPSTSSSSWSLSSFFDEARREMRGNPGNAKVVHTKTLPASRDLRELRVLRVTRGVQVIGEARDTIAYELTVTSNGPDDASAKSYADRTQFQEDDLGDVLVLRMEYPEEASQQSSAVLRVPARLAVRVENSSGTTISGVAAAHVEATRGEVTIETVKGAVTGMHQDGDVTITGVGSVKMRLSRLRSKLSGVSGGLTLDVRDGECAVDGSAGVLEVDSARAEIAITGHRGSVLVRGADGSVRVLSPASDTRVDMRRADVEVTTAGGAPVSIITTDQTARLIVSPNASFALDALSVEGEIQAADVNLAPEKTDRNTKLVHTFGKGGSRVTIRNTRGEIVVRK